MKATHKGHCQACGRLQALPSNLLALHGYKVTHGFFSGVCCGSKHLPFEVSCDMLPGFIGSACSALVRVCNEQKRLRTQPAEPIAWVHNYESLVPGQKYGKTGYVWRQVKVESRLRTVDYSNGTSSWIEYFYLAPSTNGVLSKEHKVETYYFSDGLNRLHQIERTVHVAWELNKQRADSLEKEASNLRRYISWQQERVDTWKPADLLSITQPVDAKSKAGFVPVE